MRKPRKPTDEDRRLWHLVTRDITPLRPQETPPPPPEQPPPTTATTPATSPPVAAAPQLRRTPDPAPQPTYLRPGDLGGLDGHRVEKLRRGKAPIEGRLDLHGMRRDAAHDALVAFLSTAYRGGRRNVLVITGKGSFGTGPSVLRAEVPRWLNEAPLRQMVIAYTEAHPRAGGAGALFVALRRRRDA